MLRRGEGELFHGEGILAITKALLQSGVAYVGGYQGAPVSHLLDVLVQAKDYLADLGVHVEACANEASAAAMLGASIHYPLRGAVTWKSIVGTNVAADALSNLASPGVTGGALIVVGEDYGEGASVIQERTYAFALKSSLILVDPRPELAHMVRMVEEAFALSEAANTPVMLQLRIRACHVRGSFVCSDNVAPAVSTRHLMDDPAAFDYTRLSHPPSTYRHEKLKTDERLPAARRYIVRAQAQRNACRSPRRRRHHRAGRPLQHARSARCSSSASPTASARARCRCSCSTSRIRSCPTRSSASVPASARCWWSRRASPNSSSRRFSRSCAGTTSLQHCTARTCCRWPANTRWRSSRAGSPPSSIARRPTSRSRRGRRGSPQRTNAAPRSHERSARRCRRDRRNSASAAPSGPCSRR